VALESPFSKAIDNWLLKICHLQLRPASPSAQLPIVNQHFGTLWRIETGLVERTLAKPEAVFALTA